MAGLVARLLGLGSEPCILDEGAWRVAMQRPLFDGLNPEETARLRDLACRLLADKSFSGAGGAEVDVHMATVIAAYAALPVLNLDYDWYEGWVEIVVYPGEFIHDGEETDEAGVVHHVRHQRSGESWEGGPMVLSWQDVECSGAGEGFNVVIHEFAHKLDMKNGYANGRPPLHPGMNPDDWAHDFQTAYDDFCRRVERDEDTAIDPYAAESPAEFFAVLSEYFFEAPAVLHQAYPAVYGQLQRFYLQDPLSRLRTMHSGAAS
ncbi:MAG TPA: M90 family metallopeptidase [Gallionella sp.]